jgi:hypothetical protein
MSSPFPDPSAQARRRIRQALDALADGPSPTGLAERAVRAAQRRRRARAAAAGLATAVIVGAAAFVYSGEPAPTVVTPGLTDSVTASPTAMPSPQPCVSYTTSSEERLDPASWPDFVSTVVDRLLAGGTTTLNRSDLHMSSGFAWCGRMSERSPLQAARAVVGLGDQDRAGQLVIEIYVDVPIELDSCTEVAGQVPAPIEIMFCDEPTATTPLVFGQTPINPNSQPDEEIAVIAIYSDEKVVTIELNPGFGGFAFTTEQLRDAVMDPALYALIP